MGPYLKERNVVSNKQNREIIFDHPDRGSTSIPASPDKVIFQSQRSLELDTNYINKDIFSENDQTDMKRVMNTGEEFRMTQNANGDIRGGNYQQPIAINVF